MTTASNLEQIAHKLAAFLAEANDPSAADAIAAAFARHLANLDAAKLPPSARRLWERIVTRLLKAPAGKAPIPPRCMAVIASWPCVRIAELVDAVRGIEAEVARAINDRLSDETNERVSRAYL